MAVPQDLISEIQLVSNQINNAQPLTGQVRSVIVAIQLNAARLVRDTDAAEDAAVGQLDTWTQPGDPFALVSSLQGLLVSAQDQDTICDIRSFVGRVASNMDQFV